MLQVTVGTLGLHRGFEMDTYKEQHRVELILPTLQPFIDPLLRFLC